MGHDQQPGLGGDGAGPGEGLGADGRLVAGQAVADDAHARVLRGPRGHPLGLLDRQRPGCGSTITPQPTPVSADPRANPARMYDHTSSTDPMAGTYISGATDGSHQRTPWPASSTSSS